jgi:MFS family permease
LKAILASVGALIVSISLVQLANGYIGSLVGIRLAAARVDPVVTGLVTSAYFAGYAAGALLCDRLIRRAGHIRAFAVFAGLVAASLLGHPLRFNPALWTVLRALTGFGCAGLFVVTESWLNSKAPPAARGQVFAIYMVATYTTFAASQFMLNLASPADFSLFSLAAMLLCVALALVASTRSEAPVPVAGGRIRAGELAAAAPVAVSGCFAGGLISGSFYALMPVYGESSGRSVLEISSYLALAIFGGLLMQVPLGKLSDRLDRRLVAALVALAFAALAIAIGPAARTAWFFPLWLLLGGFMSVIYPICVAHANDRMPGEKAIAVSGRLILISGVGSTLGPLFGASVMEVFGVRGLFNYLGAVAALFACFALLRWVVVRAPTVRRRRPFRLLQTIFAHDLAHAPELENVGPALARNAPSGPPPGRRPAEPG